MNQALEASDHGRPVNGSHDGVESIPESNLHQMIQIGTNDASPTLNFGVEGKLVESGDQGDKTIK